MGCFVEKLTEETWVFVKKRLTAELRLHIERRDLDDSFIGSNRVVHQESGDFVCFAPMMIRDRPSNWYFYVTESAAFCFRIHGVSKPNLEFFHAEPDAEEYPLFKDRLTEIFEHGGFQLRNPGGWDFQPIFPALKGSGK